MRLKDLPKKKLFELPEGYFEQLPQKIQMRINEGDERTKGFFLQYRLQYGLPILVILMAGAFWFVSAPKSDEVQTILAAVETDDMISFLNESDITTEDLLESVRFSSDDADEIETEVYQLHFESDGVNELIEEINEEINVENLEL